MKDFKLDSNGDVVFLNGELLLTDEKEDIAQSIRILLQSREGEFVLEESMGLAYENIFDKNPNFDYIEQDITEAIEQDDRVSSVDKVDFDFDSATRLLKVTIKATSKKEEEIELEEVEINA